MANQDEEFLEEYLEGGLSKRVVESLKRLKEDGYELSAEEETNRGVKVGKGEKMIDQVVIQGLQMDRGVNQKKEDYRVWEDEEDMGLVVCTPLHLTEPDNFIT